ncbi:TonB-dependent receptor [Parapedobacter luteus]|uniref:TonB-dependent receptor n=1 Tax=Parapedobacter luteus TaxID=623280 RepID=A0A1T5BKZ3_9SPHI|nr:TonB-dependent receptor [Parapedobacter luteus]SKB47473.1 TonB-dependent receptor [Parapedobacter luteus]
MKQKRLLFFACPITLPLDMTAIRGMMRQVCFTLPLVLLISITAFAQQNGVISGKVIDGATRLSLPGATLRVNVGNRYTVSSQTGEYEFLGVPAGTYEVLVNYLGYPSQTKTVTVAAGENSRIDFQLDPSDTQLSEVIIMGDRLRSQASALNQQKNNANISNVISSDQVGRFPDANIGDALKRVPGIAMQNDQGEARDIIIRGLAPELNSVTLNGDRIPSAEGDNRRVQMDLIPADMIQTIVVNKTLTPDMDADAIGGSVDLITRASPNGQRISATLSGGYNPIREKALYTGGFVYGNRFANDAIGIVLSGSYNNNDYGSDNIEATWVQDSHGNTYVRQQDIRKYDVQRIRRSLSGAFDFRLSENHTLTANAMYNWRDDLENRFRFRVDNVSPTYSESNPTQIVGYTGRVGRELKGGASGRNKNRRLETQQVQNYSLRGDHLLGSSIDMDWATSFSTASEKKPNERYALFRSGGFPVSFNGDNNFPLYSVSGDQMGLGFNEITEGNGFTREKEFGAKLNFRVPLSVIDDQKGRLRFGGRLRLKTKIRDDVAYEYEPIDESAFASIGNVQTVTFAKPLLMGDAFVPGTFMAPQFLGGLALTDASQFEEEAIPDDYLMENYDASERIYAGYLRWDQDFSNQFSVIVGARLEHTGIKYTGNVIEDEEDLLGTRTIQNSYTNIFPNLTFKYTPAESLVLRGAFTTALARPNYYALAPYLSVIPGSDAEIYAGNPDLNATYAYNGDLMIENYFKSIGLVSGGIFYKRLNDFIYTFVDQQYTTDKFAADFPSESNPIAPGETWQFTQMRNGSTVNLYGFEVAFQRQLDFLPGKFFRGLGIYANYTYVASNAKGVTDEDGNERDDISLPGTAPHMLNGSISWENSRFSLRASAHYTAAYLDELAATSFDDAYYDEQFFLDVNASYKVQRNMRIFAEANNLTNQPLRYYQGVRSRTMQAEYYRPRFNIGVKLDL